MSDPTPVRLVLVDDHAMFRSGVKAELDHARTTIVGEAPDVDRAIATAHQSLRTFAEHHQIPVRILWCERSERRQ